MADLHLVSARDIGESFPLSPVRVVLAENHAVLRDGMRQLLDAEDGIEVVAEAEDLESALRAVRREGPHVLVLSLGMLDGAVREKIGKLRARAPGTQVVILTMEESPVLAQHVLACGARGLVLKDRADSDLAPAVRAVAGGEEYLSPRVAERLDGALRRSLPESSEASPRVPRATLRPTASGR